MDRLRLASALVIIVTLLAPVHTGAGGFGDIDDPDVAEAAKLLSSLGVMEGWSGRFWPQSLVRRSELATIAVRLVGQEHMARLVAGASGYIDVAPNHWASGYLTVAQGLDLLHGWSTPHGRVFDPDAQVTYDHVLTVLVRVLGYETADMAADWPYGYRRAAVSVGLIDRWDPAMDRVSPSRGGVALLAARAVASVEKRAGGYLADALQPYGHGYGIEVSATREAVVANGESGVTVTARVVDEGGRLVPSYRADLRLDVPGGALEIIGDTVAGAVRGSAAWTLRAGTAHGIDAELVVTDEGGKLHRGTISLGLLRPVAASIQLEADPPQVSADGISAPTVTATIVDQAGVALTGADRDITFLIDGPGVWHDTRNTDERTEPTPSGALALRVLSRLNLPGVINVTAESAGLEGASLAIRTVPAAPPTRLSLSSRVTSEIPGGGGSAELTVSLRDRAGNLVTHPAFQVGTAYGLGSLSISYSGASDFDGPTELRSTHMGRATFSVGQDGASPLTVVVTAPALSGAQATLHFTPSLAEGAVFHRGPAHPDDPGVPYRVSAAYPLITEGIHLVDEAGSPVGAPGYSVAWSLRAGAASFMTQPSFTNAEGRALTTVAPADGYTGPIRVRAEVRDPGGVLLEVVDGPLYEVVDGPIARWLTLGLYDGPDPLSASPVDAVPVDEPFWAVATVTSSDGERVPGAHVEFSVHPDDLAGNPHPSRNPLVVTTGSGGQAVVRFEGQDEGSGSVTAVCVSVPWRPSGLRSLAVEIPVPAAAVLVGVPGVFEPPGVYELGVELRDAAGNPFPADRDYLVTLRLEGLEEGPDAGLDLRPTSEEPGGKGLDLVIESGSTGAAFYVGVGDTAGTATLVVSVDGHDELNPAPVPIIGP